MRDHPIATYLGFCRQLGIAYGEGLMYEMVAGVDDYSRACGHRTAQPFRFPVNTGSSRLHRRIADLDTEHELALQSHLYHPSNVSPAGHLPMLDLLPEKLTGSMYDGLRKLFGKFGCSRIAVFSSGRSYHAYGLGILSALCFDAFIEGAVQLGHPTTQHPEKDWVADPDWLMIASQTRRFSLRCSAKSMFRKQLPKLIETLTL